MSLSLSLRLLVLLLSASLVACASKAETEERPAYLDVQSGKPLLVAPGQEAYRTDKSEIPDEGSTPPPDSAPDIHPPNILADSQQGSVQQGSSSASKAELKTDAMGTPYLVVAGEYEEVWLELRQALRRSGFQIEYEDPMQGHIVLVVKDYSQKKPTQKKVRLLVARGYQSVRILVQEADQPVAVAPEVALPILKIIQSSL